MLAATFVLPSKDAQYVIHFNEILSLLLIDYLKFNQIKWETPAAKIIQWMDVKSRKYRSNSLNSMDRWSSLKRSGQPISSLEIKSMILKQNRVFDV